VFESVARFYSQKFHWQESAGTLLRFGDVLDTAKGLRENNNYEALLIANEFGHPTARAFLTLARNMQKRADEFLTLFGGIFAKYLGTPTDEEWDYVPEGKIAFGQLVLSDRAVEAVAAWYSPHLGRLIRNFIRPMLALGPGDPTIGGQIKDHVDMKYFSSKAGLMQHFQKAARDLESA